MFSLVETLVSACKNYFSHYWKHVFQLVETMMVAVMGFLMFLLQETGLEVMQTDHPTSTDPCYFYNNSFFTSENTFPPVEALILSAGKTLTILLVYFI